MTQVLIEPGNFVCVIDIDNLILMFMVEEDVTVSADIPIDESSTYVIHISLVGGESDATPTMYYAKEDVRLLARRDGSNPVVIESSAAGLTLESSAAGTENVDASISASGNNVRITFTGPDTSSTNMNWRAVVTLSKVVSG